MSQNWKIAIEIVQHEIKYCDAVVQLAEHPLKSPVQLDCYGFESCGGIRWKAKIQAVPSVAQK